MATRLPQQWWEGKTALITGASSGIGRAFAEALARRGTHLVLVAPRAEPLRALADTLSRVNAVQVDLVCADPRQAEVVQQVCATGEQAGQRVALLLTSDGGEPSGRWEVRWNMHPPQGVGSPAVVRVRASSPLRLVAQALSALDQGRSQVVLELAAHQRFRSPTRPSLLLRIARLLMVTWHPLLNEHDQNSLPP